MIITVTLNPAVDKTIVLSELRVGEVNRVEAVRRTAGGKGINVARMVRRFGGEPLAMGILGGDTGRFIQKELDRMGIAHDFCEVEAETRTNVKIFDRETRSSTDINERGEAVSAAVLQQVFETLKTAAKPGDTVVFAGSNPPGTPVELLRDWSAELKANGVRVFLDTSGEALRLGIQAAPTLIKPNLAELEELCGQKLADRGAIAQAIRELLGMGIRYVVVSMGADGALFGTEERILYAAGLDISVFSTVGAGDSMVASLAYDLERGIPWEEAAARAVAVSAAHVADCPDAEKPQLMETLLHQVRIEEL